MTEVVNEIRPIRCLAIVNRGEAAMRCIRAVKSLCVLEGSELKVAALYTAADRDAPFVRHADVAVQLPVKTTPVAAYLDHELILSTLKSIGADAVWPGWGFVAESSTFVDKLSAAGIRFLGPTAKTMRALGDKIASKELAEAVDVPVTPWSGGATATPEEALVHAERIGFPVVVKASAGGGGRGIRVVRDRESFKSLYESARSEAASAFGDDRMFVEAMVQGGRHIEVQIIADQHGNVVAVGCRDCSVQRRHQKVLEEAPPSGLPPLMFQALKEAALALAKRVGYSGAGTVEFLVDRADFFFLEMNPRLQVEHGITEELTGSDLVQLQIRVARGEQLPVLSYRERGFSIEARVCAEDPDAGFLPTPGRVARFDPALGRRVRMDTGVASGSTVPAAFDSLVAKVIANGDTREEARARLVGALRDFDLVIEGGATNKGYLLEILETEDYRQGGVDTTWLDRWNESRSASSEYAVEALMLAAVLSFRAARRELRDRFFRDPGNVTPDRIPASCGLELDLTHLGKSYRVEVFASSADRYRVHLEGLVVPLELSESGAHAARLRYGNQDLRVLYDLTDASIRVELEGRVHLFGRQTAGQVRATAPSMVVSLNVEEGSQVQEGQGLGVLEAMKMEIGFDAPVGGTVTEIRARKGQQVAAGDLILIIDPASEESASGTDMLKLPKVDDPLELFFEPSADAAGASNSFGEPSLKAALSANPDAQQRAQNAVGEEIRRILLGYDVYQPRLEALIQFLDAPLEGELPSEFCAQLAEVRSQLQVFVDVERVFSRSTRQRLGSGELDSLSNNALMRIFVRRLQAAGSGLPERFLDAVKCALSHYDDLPPGELDYSEALERAVLRMFACQLEPQSRYRLIGAILRRVIAASARVDLSGDPELGAVLTSLVSLRGHVPTDLADAAVDANYLIFQRSGLEDLAERTTQKLEQWLSEDEAGLGAFPDLDALAQAPSGRFRRVATWIHEGSSRRRQIAVGALVRRLYAPRQPTSVVVRAGEVERLSFGDWGDVVAVCLPMVELAAALPRVLADEPPLTAVEVFVPVPAGTEGTQLHELMQGAAVSALPGKRLTFTLVDPEGQQQHETLELTEGGARWVEGYQLHPEAAERVDLQRYQSFALERLAAAEDVYAFYGKAIEMPDDERIFILADVRGRPPEGDSDARSYLPIFERAFHEAARTLRRAINHRDSRRRLQWNRITLVVSNPVALESGLEEALANRLYPATRHLGLERVTVRVPLLLSSAGEEAEAVEFLVSDTSGNRLEIQRRRPHQAALVPVEAYQRSVVAARRRGLIYPYEIIRMLAPGGEEEPVTLRPGQGIPPGTFEEYDVDPASSAGGAVRVAGRRPGLNRSAVVFGVISTPTPKVPEGMKRVLVLSDPTRGMGALAAGECDRVVAAIDLAEQLNVPVEWLPVSSGARIAMDSGTENLDATARVVRRIVTFTQNRGVIHIIVDGVNVGAQSYWDSLATMLSHTRGALIMTPRGSMVLTGRAALAASGSVSAEDEVAIGGYERVMGPNGQAQYYAEDLADAYRILYQHYSFTYVVPGESGPRRSGGADAATRDVGASDYEGSGEFSKIGEIFDQKTNPGRKRPFAMRALMKAVVDQDGQQLERWQAQTSGETSIVWDAHLGGQPVCLIGIESQNVSRWGYRPFDGPAEWNGGTLFPVSSRKVARALNSASGNRPAVVLANLSGFDGSPESMRKLQLEYGAEIARAVVNFEGPVVFLVVSRYHGGAYVVFSRELNPELRAFAVEGSYASVIGGGPAAAVVFPREVRTRHAKDERVKQARGVLAASPTGAERVAAERVLSEVHLEKQAEVAAEFDRIHSVQRAKEVASLEGIISSSEIRPKLIELLS